MYSDKDNQLRLFHYTRKDNLESIKSLGLRPSIQDPERPKETDAHHGNGQYFTDLTPVIAGEFSRAKVSQALFRVATKWRIHGKLVEIAWIEFELPAEMVKRVHDIYSGPLKQKYPELGIWLRENHATLSANYIKEIGIVKLQ